jgi:cytochrome c556
MLRTSTFLAVLSFAVTPAFAQDFEGHIQARQGMFRINAINIGIIGNMAKGDTEYDAEAAQTAADTLVAVSQINPLVLFPEGSSNEAVENTRALPAIWGNLGDFGEKWADFGEAALALQEVAANGQEALGPALGPLGNSCKSCHDEYRASDD